MAVVALEPIDDVMLELLVDVAVSDAEADEVTPRLRASSGWTPERRAWLRDYHRSRRAGLDGRTGEGTWAAIVDGAVVGSVRLKRTGLDTLETGIWLRRSARARGVGTAALLAVVAQARAAGAHLLQADTAETNLAAQALLLRAGFELSALTADRVQASLRLGP